MNLGGLREGKDLEAGNESVAAPLLGLRVPTTNDRPAVDPKFVGSRSQQNMALDSNYTSTARQKVFLVLGSVLLLAVACLELGVALPSLLIESRSWPFLGLERYPRFLVIGDWGREGGCNQSVVADAMARKALSFRPDFVVSTGDNFYETGLVSVDDPQFNTSFSNVYYHKELQVPWLVALGNHDYGETDSPNDRPDCTKASKAAEQCFFGPLHQLDVRLTARDQRWHCERSFTASYASGAVDIFFIDTTPIIQSYADKHWAANRGGILQQSWEDQLRELEVRLELSSAAWKLVVGHHPIRTNHRPDHEFIDMVDQLEPVLIRYGAQAYFCGHDHNLQYIYNPDRQYHQITSGAGSQIGSYFYGDLDSPFQYGANGFVAVSMGRNSMRVEYLGVDSDEPLFVVEIPQAASI